MNRANRYIAMLAAPLISLGLLVGVAYSLSLRRPPEGVVAYHDEIRDLSLAVPRLVGEWLGDETDVPAPAIDLLRPNVMMSRSYKNIRTGEKVTMLFVQVRDAWNMAFHYPPVCYKYAGWMREETHERDWKIAEFDVPAMEYVFRRERFDGESRIVVSNFMVLPTGMGRDDRDVRRISDDPTRRVFGAAQVQVVFASDVPADRRREIVEELVGGYMPMIRKVVSGVTP